MPDACVRHSCLLAVSFTDLGLYIRDQFRYVLYVKNENYDKLVRCKDRAEAFLAYLVRIGRDPQVQVQFDFDPVTPF